MNVAEFFVSLMAIFGTEKCFCVTGGMAMYINRAVAQSRKIQVIYTHHEHAAASSAEGYALAKDFKVPGFCVVTSGPGVTNALTGILSAYADSAPVVIFAGQVKSSDINRFGLRTYGVQEVNAKSIYADSVKDFIQVNSENIFESAEKLVQSMKQGRKGPVILEIPLDVQSNLVPDAERILKVLEEDIKSQDCAKSDIQAKFKEIVSKILLGKKRVTFYLGNGVRISGVDTSRILRISEKSNIPRFYSWLSQDLDSSSSVLNFSCPGSLAQISSNRVLQESDLTVFLGARLDLASTAYQPDVIGGNRRILIDIDALELLKFNRQNDVKICSDLSELISLLEDCFEGFKNSDEWVKNSIALKDASRLEEEIRLENEELSIRLLARRMSEYVGRGTIVMSSSGYAAETLVRFYLSREGVRFFHGGGLGAMGQGLSQGIGAACARASNEHRILIVESDGGLWMAIHELLTLKTIDSSNIALVNMNNQGYASIFNSQMRVFGDHFGTCSEDGILMPDWRELTRALGISYKRVSSKKELMEMMNSGFPKELTFIDYLVDKTEQRGPQLKTVITPTGPTTEPFANINW